MPEAVKSTTPEVAVKLNLRGKLARAMAETERVEMRGENRFHHYKFAKAADVYAEVRVPFGKYGIVVIPNEVEIKDLEPRQTRNEGLMFTVRVTMEYAIMDADSDEVIKVRATGEGQDSGDKAIAKAKTFAYKYFLQQLTMLPTGDDPEDEREDATVTGTRPMGRTNPTRPASDAPAGTPESATGTPEEKPPAQKADRVLVSEEVVTELAALIQQAENPDATHKALLKQCGVDSLNDLSPAQGNWLMESLKRKAASKAEGAKPRK